MTYDEIIKALKGSILNAKRLNYKAWSIDVYKLENALDLINRLKAENEMLKVDLAKCSISLDNLHKAADEIRTEAIKDFAWRLKYLVIPQKAYGYTREIVLKRDIDNLVKEMTEVETNQRKESERK